MTSLKTYKHYLLAAPVGLLLLASIGFAGRLTPSVRPSVGDAGGHVLGLLPNPNAQPSGGQSRDDQDDRDRARSCSNETVKGPYGVSFQGTIFAFGPVAASAEIVSDGDGGLTGTYVETLNGVIKRGGFTGSYTVRADCTVSATLASLVPGSWTGDLDGVIVSHGTQIFLVGTDSVEGGLAVTGLARKL